MQVPCTLTGNTIPSYYGTFLLLAPCSIGDSYWLLITGIIMAYKCQKCGVEFPTPQGLSSHSRAHKRLRGWEDGKRNKPSKQQRQRSKMRRALPSASSAASGDDSTGSSTESSCSGEDLIGMQPGDSGYSSLDDTATGSDEQSDDEEIGADSGDLLWENDGGVGATIGHKVPSIDHISHKFASLLRPPAFDKLDLLEKGHMAAARLITKLGIVSRANLKSIHEYVETIFPSASKAELPDAQTVRRVLRKACSRVVGVDKRSATFDVQEGPGVPAHSITFEVRQSVLGFIIITQLMLLTSGPTSFHCVLKCY